METKGKKAALNKMYEKGTGGGPNRTQKFSPTEEAIFQLIGINEAVEGVGSSQSFGLPSPEKKRREENTISEISVDEIVLNTIEIGTRSPTAHIFQIEEIPPNSSDQQTPKKRKAVNMTTNEVVMKELETQKKLCSEISNAISVMKEHNGEIICLMLLFAPAFVF